MRIKKIGTIIYVIGALSSLTAMFLTQMMGSNDLHMIEHCLAVFIVGAVMVCVSDLYDLWRGDDE